MDSVSEALVIGTTYKLLRMAIEKEEKAILSSHTKSERELHGHKMSAYKRLLRDLATRGLQDWLQ